MDKNEARHILANAFLQGENIADSLTLTIARKSNKGRQRILKSQASDEEKKIAACLEISRRWRGYSCRKMLQKLFSKEDRNVKISQEFVHPVVSEVTKSSTAESLNVIQDKTVTDPKKAEAANQPSTPSPIRRPQKDTTGTQSIQYSPRTLQLNKDGKTKRHSPRSHKKLSQKKVNFTKHEAAIVIQKAWRRHIDMQVFRYYQALINFHGQGDPAVMLRCINPLEAQLLDSAAGIHIKFRLAGEKFPPNIYYKIFTHRPIIDMCANSPKDYTKPSAKQPMGKQQHNKSLPLFSEPEKETWYQRVENNGWRLVSDRLIHAAMDPTTWETSLRKVEFHYSKPMRKADLERKRRRKKIEWMQKMYKQGMLKSKQDDKETSDLVDRAAHGLTSTITQQGPGAVMEWEIDELLQWTTALNFDDYLESWKETATSGISENTIPAAHNSKEKSNPQRDSVSLPFDPYALTRESSNTHYATMIQDESGVAESSSNIGDKYFAKPAMVN